MLFFRNSFFLGDSYASVCLWAFFSFLWFLHMSVAFGLSNSRASSTCTPIEYVSYYISVVLSYLFFTGGFLVFSLQLAVDDHNLTPLQLVIQALSVWAVRYMRDYIYLMDHWSHSATLLGCFNLPAFSVFFWYILLKELAHSYYLEKSYIFLLWVFLWPWKGLNAGISLGEGESMLPAPPVPKSIRGLFLSWSWLCDLQNRWLLRRMVIL